MKRILFFIESLSGGGAEKVCTTILTHLDYSQYNITLLTVSDIGIYKNDIDKQRVHYQSLCGNSFSLWYRLKYKLIYQYLPASWVYKLFIPKGYDTVIAFTEGYCTKILSHASCHKIAWVHIDLKSFPWTLNKHVFSSLEEEMQCYKKYDKTICVSHSVETIMKDYYQLNNTITIYNPLNLVEIQQKGKELPIINISKDCFNMISIGRLEKQKGYDLLIPIIARLKRRKKRIQFYLVGEGSEKEYLEELVKEYHIENDVIFTGFIDNPYALLSKMDLFICSSRAEGFSLVIAEALLLGVPVVSTYCSGPNELLHEGKYGKLCANYQSLGKTLSQCIINENYFEELKEKAVMSQKQFDFKYTLKQIENLL